MKKTILIVVGRSGGHIFPGLAIAEALEKQESNIKIHFVHEGSLLERRIFSSYSYKTKVFRVGALAKGQNFLTRLKTLFLLPFALMRIVFFIFQLQPHFVIGTGGSLSGAFMLASWLLQKPRAIWEANARLGLAHLFCLPFVNKVFTFFENIPRLKKTKQIVVGYPYRSSLDKPSSASNESHVFSLLILGGSQGSRLINTNVARAVASSNWPKDIFVFHQTGLEDFEKIKKMYLGKDHAEAWSFTPDIEVYYNRVQLIVSRAGAGAIAEAAYFKKALVLIPLLAGDSHQLANAKELSQHQQAKMLLEDDFSPESFIDMVKKLKASSEIRKTMVQNLSVYSKKNGSLQIAQEILK